MPSELDHAPHLLLLAVETDDKTEKSLIEGSVSVLEKAGATFETILVKQSADLAIAASFAAKSRKFDALIVLAALPDSDQTQSLTATGLQHIGIKEKTSIAFGHTNDLGAAKKHGANAADSALRLFAIKARFNPMLNEA